MPPGDDEEMATRIISLLRDPTRATEMGRRGRLMLEEKFTCEIQLARTEELYEKLLAARTAANVANRKELSHGHNAPASDRP